MHMRQVWREVRISTHAPRTGSDRQQWGTLTISFRFQPTLPARGATDSVLRLRILRHVISTHAPRTGSDHTSLSVLTTSSVFQPTLPARGATSITADIDPDNNISTHAPRTGSDPVAAH